MLEHAAPVRDLALDVVPQPLRKAVAPHPSAGHTHGARLKRDDAGGPRRHLILGKEKVSLLHGNHGRRGV